MKKKALSVLTLALLVAVVISLATPTKVDITHEGFLSMSSRVALAVMNPPDSETTGQSYQIGDEVIERRTRSSKTFWLGGASYSWDGTIGSIHYDDNGWQEIDSYFGPALAPWDWEMLRAGYHIRVKEDFTTGQILEFEVDGETVQFQPMALEWTNDLNQIQQVSMPQSTTPVITNPVVDLLPAVGMPSRIGTIRWDDAYGAGIDFEWRCSTTRLLKTLVVSGLLDLPPPQQYILDGGNPVLRLNLIFDPSKSVDIYVDGELWNRKDKKQTFKVIEFRKDGEVLWGFMPLEYWDSSPEQNLEQSIATLEKRGNKLYISIGVPYEWLQNAVYPVFIDTDVDEQVVSSWDDCYRRLVSSTFSREHTLCFAGAYSSSYYQYGSGFRFQTVAIEGTINVCYLTLTCSVADSGTLVKTRISAEDVDDAATFAFTAAAFDARWAARTTARVDWDDLPSWVVDTEYNSPSIVPVIQEVVDRDGWVSGNDIVTFWEDFEDRTAHSNKRRRAYSYDGSSTLCPKLHAEYTAAAAGISNVPTSKAFGTLEVNTYSSTAINHFTITNTGSGAVDITVHATDLTGGDDTWTLSDTATPGENIYGLKAGLDDDDDLFDVIVKKSEAYNELVNNLAEDAAQDWGLRLYMPTSVTGYDGQQMTSTLTLVCSAH